MLLNRCLLTGLALAVVLAVAAPQNARARTLKRTSAAPASLTKSLDGCATPEPACCRAEARLLPEAMHPVPASRTEVVLRLRAVATDRAARQGPLHRM